VSRQPGFCSRLRLLPPLGVLIIGGAALALAKVSSVGGLWIHLVLVAPWCACLVWTWRWTMGWRGARATAGLALALLVAIVAGELVQVWLPLHTVELRGVLFNLYAAVVGTVLAAGIEWAARRACGVRR
jgi:hypothetical protein